MASKRRYTEATGMWILAPLSMDTGLLLSFHSHPSKTTRSIIICNWIRLTNEGYQPPIQVTIPVGFTHTTGWMKG